MSGQKSYRYRVVDVFTRQALEGNPLAVFPDMTGLNDTTMQRVAKELNLSETVFFAPSARADCAMRLRIFTPSKELAFAGHPTIGTAFILRDEKLVPREARQFAVEEGIGPVSIGVDAASVGEEPLIWLTTPPIARGKQYDRARCAEVLGLEIDELLDVSPQMLSAGNPTLFIAVKEKASVDRSSLNSAAFARLKSGVAGAMCVFIFAPVAEGAYSRMFGPDYGILEDPATGSSTGPLAAYMMDHNLISSSAGLRFVSEQGTKMGRRSILHIAMQGERGVDGIEVGGHVTPLTEAVMKF